MNKGSVLNWLRKHGINVVVKDNEVKLNCPKCQHPNFFFNVAKGVGWCHRASCHWKPSVSTLSDFWGTEPGDVGWVPSPVIQTKEFSNEITLPPSTYPIVTNYQSNLITEQPMAYEWLIKRNLTPYDIYKWGMVADHIRIYVPVYSQGILRQYVGRMYRSDLTNGSYFKYKYASESSISNFLFGWDDQDWSWLTLVENTFVSIWLRDVINCTTAFGSNLSKTQIDLIKRSKINQVILLLDSDAFEKAYYMSKGLKSEGVNSKIIRIAGQPDDYPLDFIKNIVLTSRFDVGDAVLDVREECLRIKL